jgi:hypothetical protein
VTNLNDAGMGSLRDAIASTPAGGTVDFQPGLSGTITLTSGELEISRNMTVLGPGADVITVSGNHASRVFYINADVTLSGMTIAQGQTGYIYGDGSGIMNDNRHTLTVSGCTIRDNSTEGFGGGIMNTFGTLTVTGSTLSGNSAGSSGGGIYNNGTLTVTDSSLSGNSARYTGGGIANQGTLTVTDSTISGNSVGSVGGGIYTGLFGTLTVTNSTLSGNSADNGGGGIFNSQFATVTVTGSMLSGNSASYGIYNSQYATLTITNSTISGNTSSGAGSGIYNDGTLAVRGLVTIDGDYFQTANGTLAVRIGGLSAGTDYDQLVVNGRATLGGTLDVHLVNGYQPQPGDQFEPLLFAQGQGTFAQYTGDTSGFSFLYVYEDGDFLPPGLTLVAN